MAIQASVKGKLIVAKTASFNDGGRDIAYGKIQLLVPDQSGEFFAIQNIKVKPEKFSQLTDLQTYLGQTLTIDLDVQTFGKRTDYYFHQVSEYPVKPQTVKQAS